MGFWEGVGLSGGLLCIGFGVAELIRSKTTAGVFLVAFGGAYVVIAAVLMWRRLRRFAKRNAKPPSYLPRKNSGPGK